MPYSAFQEAEIKREFATRRRRQSWIVAGFALPVVLLAIASRNHPGPIDELMGVPIKLWLLGVLAFMAVLVVLSFRNWRCPACGGPLSRTFQHLSCRRCGAVLQ